MNTARHDRLEVVPAGIVPGLPLSLRPHFIRRVDGWNGKTEHHSQGYATRHGAVRAARKAAKIEALRVVVLDTTGRVVRVHLPRVKR